METLIPLYKELRRLTREQTRWIINGDYDRLLENLAEKQKIIDRINNLGTEKTITPDQEIRAELFRLIQEIKAVEAANLSELKRRFQDVKEKLSKLGKGKQGMQAYKRKNNYEPRFLDRKG